MSERATVFQQTQVGVEVTPGTQVPATKRLLAVNLEPKAMVPTVAQRNMGSKFVSSTFNKKEYTMADLKGEACFRTMAYLLSGILQAVSPSTVASGVYLWTFQPNPYGPDTVKTFTVEAGSTAGAESFGFGMLDSLALRFTKDEVGLSGSMFGQVLAEQITMTTGSVNDVWHVNVGSSATGTFRLEVLGDWTTDIDYNANATAVGDAIKALETVGDSDVTVSGAGSTGSPWIITFVGALAGQHIVLGFDVGTLDDTLNLTNTVIGKSASDVTPIPMDPTQVDVYIDDLDDVGSPAQLTRSFETEFAINNRFTQVMTQNTSEASFSGVVEKAPELTASVVIEHDSVAAAFMADLRDKANKVCKIVVTGPQIASSGHDFSMTITFPFHFKDNARGDKDDVWCSTYHLQPIYNATLGYCLKVELQTDLASL